VFLRWLGASVATVTTSVLAACGGNAATATSTAAGSANPATSPTLAASATQASTSMPAGTSTASAAASTTATTAAPRTTTTTASSSAAGSVAGAATTVEFLAYISNPVESKQFAGYAKTFEASNAGIHVQVIESNTPVPKLTAMLAGGTPPNIVQLNNSDASGFLAKNAFEPLDPLIASDKYDLSDFYPAAYSSLEWQGKKYGLSTDLYVVGFYYVPDLFAAAGVATPQGAWTWEQARTAATKLTKPDGSQFGMHVYNDYARWCSVVWNYGGHFFDRQNNPQKAQFTDSKVVDAISLWVDMVNKDHSSPTNADNAKNKQLQFWFGTMAMDVVDGPTILSLVTKNKADLKWAVAPYPKGPGAAADQGSVAFADALEIAHGAKNPEATWTVFKYFVGPQFLTTFMTNTGRMPSRKSLAEGAAYLKLFKDAGVQNTAELAAQAGAARPLAVTPAGSQIRTIANKEMAQSWAGTRAVKDSLLAIQQQVQPLLDQLHA
jgi:multiple sugar transport system substrate-binding protein